MTSFAKGIRRATLFTAMLLLAAVLARECAATAADIDETDATRNLECLGGVINPHDRSAGRPVTTIAFRRGSDFGDENVPLLKAFSNLTAIDLRHTKISGTHIVGAGLKELSELKSLRTLTLINNSVGDGALKEISGLKSLTALFVANAPISDAGLKDLRQLRNLTTLCLSGDRRLSDKSLKELKEMKCLADLNLVDTQITDAGLKELKGFKNLATLRLSYTKISGTGFNELRELKKLTLLSVNYTPLTDAGLRAIGELKSLKMLYLGRTEVKETDYPFLKDLYRGRKITAVALQGLRASLPHTEISIGDSY